jgi:hypothetical protein
VDRKCKRTGRIRVLGPEVFYFLQMTVTTNGIQTLVEVSDSLTGCDLGNICARAERKHRER